MPPGLHGYDSGAMPLSDAEVRVLGALTEKERTTPDGYPLSMQGLHTACNQKTSRDPVTNLHLQEVQEALQRLRERGLAGTIQQVSDRVPKHRHLLAEALDLKVGEIAVLSVLMLRGPQTPGELRARTERIHSFADTTAVEGVLQRLAERPAPLVKNLGRGPGQSQDRWMQTFGGDEQRMQPRVRSPRPAQPSTESSGRDEGASLDENAVGTRVRSLEAQVHRLERRIETLEARLGVSDDRADP